MKRTAFITGITGQDGSYLSELLLDKGYKVIGLVSKKYNIGWENINHIKEKLILEEGDLLDEKSLERILKKHRPGEVYNLGALTFVPSSWENTQLVLDINMLGVVRLLAWMRKICPKSRFFQATSSKIFGDPEISPQDERTQIAPIDPYGVSKAAAHFLVKGFREKFNIFAVSGIMFNHESPRRGIEFVTRKITQAVVKIKLGKQRQLLLGNLKAKQDWGYAPDYMKAAWMMLQQKKPEDFVIATGKLHTVAKACQIAFSHLGLYWQKFVKIDKSFIRKKEPKALVGDATKAKKILGWRPSSSFKEMIKLMVEEDIKKLAN